MSEVPSGSLSFSGVKEASEKRMTRPGVKDVFLIKEISFGETDNTKNPFMKCVFDRKEDSFSESFFFRGKDEKKTQKMLGRVQTLVKAATQQELTDDVSYQMLVTKLLNKQLALKVSGRVDEQSGRGFPTLSFGGFAKPADQLAFLEFTPDEEAAVKLALDAIENSSSSNADREAGGGSEGAGEGTGRRKF